MGKLAIVKLLEHVTDNEINRLTENLNKIKGFKFRIKTVVEVTPNPVDS